MPEAMPFAATVVDQSNATGFQFEFRCLRCGTAYSSRVHAVSSLAADAGGKALKKAGGLLGNRAGKMFEAVGDYVGDRAADAVKDQVKDRAFQEAVQEVAPQFILCPGCRRWMCRQTCFNAAAGLCHDCASQEGATRPPASLPDSAPPPWNSAPPSPSMSTATPPPQPMPAEYASPPGQTPYPGYALPPVQPQSGPAAPPPYSVNPGHAPRSRALPPGSPPALPLQVHIRASRHHPGTVSLVVVDANDKVVATLHLDPDDAEDLAEDLHSSAQAAMRRVPDRR